MKRQAKDETTHGDLKFRVARKKEIQQQKISVSAAVTKTSRYGYRLKPHQQETTAAPAASEYNRKNINTCD
ncbi:MAG: hypothetical protein MJZ35_00165 [Bacteroidaceae bacterium]|nr:hypothetical protein [Bacteroidaceae bacterium]